MNKITLFGFLFLIYLSNPNSSDILAKDYIERQGKVTFFSYTSVENIQATNNQTLSFFNSDTNEIAVRILMRAFVFEKSLMYEHFNESYIESDLYPEATFSGKILNFDPNIKGKQTRIIKGEFTLKNITEEIEIKAEIIKDADTYLINGKLDINIEDYNIKVPALLSPNIAKKIEVMFNFKYTNDEV